MQTGLSTKELPVNPASRPAINERWEAFLTANPRGQFQQSWRWAYVKEVEGWVPRLVTWGDSETIHGGFLILIKMSRLGRVGFVNKGPVLREEDPQSIAEALVRVRHVVHQEGLRALIVQPPDGSKIGAQDLQEAGFCRRPVPRIIDATLVASLAGGREAIRLRMWRSTRQDYRRATEHGVEIVEGTRKDLGRFFELMCQTCRRQRVQPNPSSVALLYRRWDAFAPQVRVMFARVQGETVAGLLLLRFGKRCTFEKKGWNGRFPEVHPNTFLNFEAMVQAEEWGCEWVDFVGMDRSLAERMLRGESVKEELARTRYVFNVRLGARPVLLTPAHVYLPNLFQKWLLVCWLGRPGLVRWLKRKIAL